MCSSKAPKAKPECMHTRSRGATGPLQGGTPVTETSPSNAANALYLNSIRLISALPDQALGHATRAQQLLRPFGRALLSFLTSIVHTQTSPRLILIYDLWTLTTNQFPFIWSHLIVLHLFINPSSINVASNGQEILSVLFTSKALSCAV
jgi:hypothetical protein